MGRRLLWALVAGPPAVVVILYAVAWLLPAPEIRPEVRPSNLILDRRGRLLYEWVDPNAAQHRPVALEDVAPACVQATIATEDARFFRHPGVDVIAIARSVYRHFRYGVPLTGASTLTQQLVRRTLLPPEERYSRSLWRKLKEAWLAWRLERHLSKEEILTLYLNYAYYGNFAVGIEAASHAYFGRAARDLDLAQCAMLAGLPQAPAEWNPLVHPRAARARQAVVLDRMVAEGFITEEEKRRVLEEPLVFAATPFPIRAPHFVTLVQATLERWLGPETLRRGGWVIWTTLDLDVQREAERLVRRQLARLNADPNAPPDRRVTAAAVVVMNPTNGDVVAMVGSPNYFDAANAGAVNMALSLRQPGSAIKPFVYAAAFDPRHPHPWSPGTLLADERTPFLTAEGEVYVPQNFDGRWHGVVPVRVALGSSLNTPAVKALQHAGLSRFLGLADAVGLSSLARHPHPDWALALGAGEVSLLELTRAYAALANGGRTVEPRYVLRVTHNGQPVEGPWSRELSAHRALDPRVAFLVTDVLRDRAARVITFGLNSVLDISPYAAVKTGTTTDWRDAWTVGYTRRWAVGVWVGNWDNAPMAGLTGSQAAAPIWRGLMSFLHRQAPPRPFPRPKGVERTRVCAETGRPPTPSCQRVVEDWRIAGTSVEWITPEARRLLAQGGRNAEILRPRFLSPDPQATFRVDPDMPPAWQVIPLAVEAPPGSKVRFDVDGVVLAEQEAPPYEVWWPLQEGTHRVRAQVRLPDGRLEVLETHIDVTR